MLGGDRGLACRVLAFAGGEDLAQDDLADLARIDPGALQRLDDRHLPEFVRRKARERAAERPNRGAGGAGDDDLVHRPLLRCDP